MAKKFKKPTPAEVTAYAISRNYPLDGDEFCDYYEMRGWIIGKTPMKDWQAAVRYWERLWRKRTGNYLTDLPQSSTELSSHDADEAEVDAIFEELNISGSERNKLDHDNAKSDRSGFTESNQ